MTNELVKLAVCLAGTGLLMMTSGLVVRGVLRVISRESMNDILEESAGDDDDDDDEERDGRRRGATARGVEQGGGPDATALGLRVKRIRDTGLVVGKCENILIVVLVLLDAYTALSIIFAGKAWIRRREMRRGSLYFLAGTMVNVTYSVLFALGIKLVLVWFWSTC